MSDAEIILSTIDDVRAVARRIDGIPVETPLLDSPYFNWLLVGRLQGQGRELAGHGLLQASRGGQPGRRADRRRDALRRHRAFLGQPSPGHCRLRAAHGHDRGRDRARCGASDADRTHQDLWCARRPGSDETPLPDRRGSRRPRVLGVRALGRQFLGRRRRRGGGSAMRSPVTTRRRFRSRSSSHAWPTPWRSRTTRRETPYGWRSANSALQGNRAVPSLWWRLDNHDPR